MIGAVGQFAARSKDSVLAVTTPGVEIRGRNGPFMAHHPLHNVDRHTIVEQVT
jgi:hypothetical protein